MIKTIQKHEYCPICYTDWEEVQGYASVMWHDQLYLVCPICADNCPDDAEVLYVDLGEKRHLNGNFAVVPEHF